MGCENKPKDVDVSTIKIELEFQPFYKDFAALDTINFGENLLKLSQKYPDFTDFFLDTLLPFQKVNKHYLNADSTETIRNIFTFKDYVALTDTVLKVFPDTKKQDEQIIQLLKLNKHYFPNVPLPTKVVYFESFLNKWTAFVNGNTLGIGLDMFLGPQFRPYEAIGMPQYALLNHTPECIPLWAAKAVYQVVQPSTPPYGFPLLDYMIANGKEIFYLSKVLPKMETSLFFSYTPAQLKWCEENEALIFNLFLQQNLLYSKDQQKIMRYVTPGPNSAGFPAEAPGDLGSFIGYKIMLAYEKQTGKSLAESIDNLDANAIFQLSKYKP